MQGGLQYFVHKFVCVCYHVFCQYVQQDDNIEILARFLIVNDLI